MRLLATVAFAATLLGAELSYATPAQDFSRARETFRRGEYREAIPLLKDLLYPNARLSSRSDLAEAHLLLGVSHFETGNKAEAEVEFEKALRYDVGLTLDPLLFSEGAVAFFEGIKAAYKKKAEQEAEKLRLAEERDRYRKALENLYVYEKRSYYVNFIPFGAGQFQNGDNGKGLFFSVSESLTCGASGVIFSYLILKYGLGGDVPPEEAGSVRRWQQVQVAAGTVCLGLMTWGVVDSLMNYESTYRTTPDPSLLPPELRPPNKQQSKSSREKRPKAFYLLPTAGPDGGGLVLSWEF